MFTYLNTTGAPQISQELWEHCSIVQPREQVKYRVRIRDCHTQVQLYTVSNDSHLIALQRGFIVDIVLE